MSRLTPLTSPVTARVEPCALDRRYTLVDTNFAAQLRTEHTRRFELTARSTPAGDERFDPDVPNASREVLAHLDDNGLARVGTAVTPGMILIGRSTPLGDMPRSNEERLLRAIFGEGALEYRDTSLRAPPGCFGVVRRADIEDGERRRAIVEVAWERALDVGDVLQVDGQPVVVAELRELSADLAWSGGASKVSVAKVTMARDVLHARSIGPYSPHTQQPLAGREQLGGQPITLGQIERLATHAPWTAWELLTLKADSSKARARLYDSLLKLESPDLSPAPSDAGRKSFSFFEPLVKTNPGEAPAVAPEAATLLVALLRSLAFEPDLRPAEVSLRIATPGDIRAHSHGAVQPTLEGLASQRLFGPVKDYACACGKLSRMADRGLVCDECGVDVIRSNVRRQRFGHIELAAPCLHPLFVGEVATLLGLREDEVRAVVSGERALVSAGVGSWQTEPGTSAHRGRGLWEALEQLDLAALAGETGPRAELAATLRQSGQSATALMLAVVPVLPPALRVDDPPASEGPSTLDRLYLAVLERNERVAHLAGEGAPESSQTTAQALLQHSIDHLLLEASDGPSSEVQAIAGRIDGLLADGIFSKHVDFSGIAHLVVDPSLSPEECRVSREMLLELFRQHAFGVLEARNYTLTLTRARRMLDQRQPEALAAVEEASDGYPVLLMAGSAVVCRRVRGWDAPAIAVDPATAERLDSLTVTLHVPVTHEAALQCEQLADLPTARKVQSDGWLCRARRPRWLRTAARQAALAGERDALADPVVRLALGWLPAPVDAGERERWAERERERREQVWARVQPTPSEEEPSPSEKLDRPLAELELSDRTSHALASAGLRTLGELCTRREVDLLKLPDFRRKELLEVKSLLGELGLSLGMSFD